ncbi:MAG: hypothetical protein ACE5WD_09115 [Candidatus Aminicenantia bacterium]
MEQREKEGKEIKLDLRKNTLPENLKIVHERLNSLGPWDILITISDYDPELIFEEINFLLPGLWKFEKHLNQEGVWEAKWRLNPMLPFPWIEEKVRFIEK